MSRQEMVCNPQLLEPAKGQMNEWEAHNQNIPEGQFGLPVSLQGIDTHASRRFLHVRVPYTRSERGFWRALREIFGDLEV